MAQLTAQQFIQKYIGIFADNTTGQIGEGDLRDFAQDIADSFGSAADFEQLSLAWAADITYNTTDTIYAEAHDRLYKSKVDNNLGHQPPSAPDVDGIYQDAWWLEISRAETSPIKEWAPGLYGSGLVIVAYNFPTIGDQLLKLNVSQRPFESSDIVAELAAGQWKIYSNAVVSGGTAGNLVERDANGNIVDAGVSKDQLFEVSDVDVSDISEGESKIPTVVKQGGVPVISGAVRKVDKLGPASLANYLDDSKNWVNGVLEINAANPESTHPLGYNGLEWTYKRRWFLCRSHVYDDVNGYAKWEMNTMITMLNSADSYDQTIISQLENTAGWVDDLKVVTIKSVKGDQWVQTSTGYSFQCIDNNNTWFRIRSTYLNLITDATLINAIKAVTDAQWGASNVYNLPSGNQGDFFADDSDGYTYFCINTPNHTFKRVGQRPYKLAAISDATLIAEIEAHDFVTTPKLVPVATEKGVHLQEHCWENPTNTINYARKVKISGQYYWVKIK